MNQYAVLFGGNNMLRDMILFLEAAWSIKRQKPGQARQDKTRPFRYPLPVARCPLVPVAVLATVLSRISASSKQTTCVFAGIAKQPGLSGRRGEAERQKDEKKQRSKRDELGLTETEVYLVKDQENTRGPSATCRRLCARGEASASKQQSKHGHRPRVVDCLNLEAGAQPLFPMGAKVESQPLTTTLFGQQAPQSLTNSYRDQQDNRLCAVSVTLKQRLLSTDGFSQSIAIRAHL